MTQGSVQKWRSFVFDWSQNAIFQKFPINVRKKSVPEMSLSFLKIGAGTNRFNNYLDSSTQLQMIDLLLIVLRKKAFLMITYSDFDTLMPFNNSLYHRKILIGK